MNFGFTEEQDLLRAELRKFLDQNASLEEVRKQVESPEGFSRPLWTRMAELGWVGLTIPEAYGGVGMDFVTLVVVLEETGRTLFPSPLVSTVLAAKAIEKLGSAEQRQRWLPGLADGSRIGTLAVLEASDRLDPEGIELRGQPQGDGFALTGEKRFVSDAGKADLFDIPMFHVAGWFDFFLRGTMDGYTAMCARHGTDNQFLVAGPWVHMPWGDHLAGCDYGGEARPGIDGLLVQWFDRWLKDREPDEPLSGVRYFVTGENQWKQATKWPPEEAVDRTCPKTCPRI